MRDGVTHRSQANGMVGERPLLWHVMRYYAHFGHTDFVLCLGYGAVGRQGFLPATTTRPDPTISCWRTAPAT